MTIDIAPIMGMQVGVEFLSKDYTGEDTSFLVINLFIVTILVTFS